MIQLLDMNRSRPIAISRFSGSLVDVVAIFIRCWVISISMIQLLDMNRSGPVAISSRSRPLFVVMINFISIRSMVGLSVLVDIGMPMTVAVSSRSFMITSISLNSLGTSVVVAYS